MCCNRMNMQVVCNDCCEHVQQHSNNLDYYIEVEQQFRGIVKLIDEKEQQIKKSKSIVTHPNEYNN